MLHCNRTKIPYFPRVRHELLIALHSLSGYSKSQNFHEGVPKYLPDPPMPLWSYSLAIALRSCALRPAMWAAYSSCAMLNTEYAASCALHTITVAKSAVTYKGNGYPLESFLQPWAQGFKASQHLKGCQGTTLHLLGWVVREPGFDLHLVAPDVKCDYTGSVIVIMVWGLAKQMWEH